MQRLLGLFVLLVAGVMSLPVSAAPFDSGGSENWIIPAQLGGMAAIGALVAIGLPGLTGARTPGRRALFGALIGVGMALVGVLIFFLLLSGFDGA